jgi:hypothetical protein
MSNTATVTLPDSSVYTRKTDAAYTHAAVLSFDRAYAIEAAEHSLDVHERGQVSGATTAAQLRAARKALDVLRSSTHERVFVVTSLHTSKAAAEGAALRAARKAGARGVVIEVVLA